jgi:putative ABC transport system ATP-binding protein
MTQRLTVAALTVVRGHTADSGRRILDNVDLVIEPGAVVAITGPSGAGKTTLLQAIAGLTRPATGSVAWGALEISRLPQASCDHWRRNTVGLVFQDFQLVGELGTLANVMLPASFDHWRTPALLRDRAIALLGRVGLDARAGRAASLSPGEQQRLAIARALVRDPRLILADEPTASLDTENAVAIADLLVGTARQCGASLMMVSHDSGLLRRADHVLRLAAGRLMSNGGLAG